MLNDPIVEEVRRVRQEYAKRFNYDLRGLAADLPKPKQEHAERLDASLRVESLRLVSFPAKPARRKKTA